MVVENGCEGGGLLCCERWAGTRHDLAMSANARSTMGVLESNDYASVGASEDRHHIQPQLVLGDAHGELACPREGEQVAKRTLSQLGVTRDNATHHLQGGLRLSVVHSRVVVDNGPHDGKDPVLFREIVLRS